MAGHNVDRILIIYQDSKSTTEFMKGNSSSKPSRCADIRYFFGSLMNGGKLEKYLDLTVQGELFRKFSGELLAYFRVIK